MIPAVTAGLGHPNRLIEMIPEANDGLHEAATAKEKKKHGLVSIPAAYLGGQCWPTLQTALAVDRTLAEPRMSIVPPRWPEHPSKNT